MDSKFFLRRFQIVARKIYFLFNLVPFNLLSCSSLGLFELGKMTNQGETSTQMFTNHVLDFPAIECIKGHT